MYPSPGRLCQVLVGVSLVFHLGCQQSLPLNSTLGNLPQQPSHAKELEISASTYFAHAHLLERQGQFEQAARQYHRALALQPELLSARNRLGITLNKLGRHTEASAQFRWALARHPATAYLHNNLGFSLYLEGRYEQAEAALCRALELKPDFARAHMNHAVALARQDRLDEAFAELKQAGSEADAHFNMGVILVDAEEYDKAGRYLETALAIQPDFDAARQQLQEVARLAAEAQARQAALALVAEANADEASSDPAVAVVDDALAEEDVPESTGEVGADTIGNDEMSSPPAQVVGQVPTVANVPESPGETVVARTPLADETPEPWETLEVDETLEDEAPGTIETDVAEVSSEDVTPQSVEDNATDATVDEEIEVEMLQPTEAAVADAYAGSVMWDGMEMVWLDYAGPEDVSDAPVNPPSAPAEEETEAPQFAQEPGIDAEVLFAMISEAIADLRNQDADSFDSLWCRLGYYLFPETAPEEPEPESEWLADQTDIREAAADRPIGK